MAEFEKDITVKRNTEAGLAEARAALQIVESIYQKGGI